MEIPNNSKLQSKGLVDDIIVYDNFVDTDIFCSLYTYLCNKNEWRYGTLSSQQGEDTYDIISGKSSIENTPFWRMNLTEDAYVSGYIFDKVKEITQKDWDIEEIYVNGATYGQSGSFHVDNDKGYTFLIYTNIHWDVSWGGKTIFYDENGETRYIEPIPNRAILFPGTIIHCSEDTTRKFRGLRMTTAFKLFPKEEL